MGLKGPIFFIFNRNRWFLLQFLCIVFGFLPFIVSDESFELNHDDRIAEAKAKILKIIQKETFQLSGFDEFATIPITYPLDICLMEVDNNLYAACLAHEKLQNETITVLKVLRKVPEDRNNPLYDYVEMYSYETLDAQNMDCVSMGSVGYIAVINQDDDGKDSNDGVAIDNDTSIKGSPIFQLKSGEVTVIQAFQQPDLKHVHFLKHHEHLFMWQSFETNAKSIEQSNCSIFRLQDAKFNQLDHIPCINAQQVTPFIIDHQIFVAVANYMDQHRNIETHSTIFTFDTQTHKFNLTQKIKTYGAVDVQHVNIENFDFLIVANSFHARTSGESQDTSSNAVVYRFEHAKFVPMQILPFDAEVRQLLPFKGESNEFVLLVSMKAGTTKTYQFDGFEFSGTPITFTGGSLGRGVSQMRTYKMNNEFLVLVVANTEMYRDATNLYRLKFTAKLQYDFTKAIHLFDEWYAGIQEKLKNDGMMKTFEAIQALKPPPGFGVMTFDHVSVDTIYTETLSSASIPIDFNKLRKSLNRAEQVLSKEILRRPKRLNDSMLQQIDLNSSRFDIDDDNRDDLKPEWLDTETTLTIDELTVGHEFYVEKINGHNASDLLQLDSDINLNTLIVDKLIIATNSSDFDEIDAKLLESDRHSRAKREGKSADNENDVLNLGNVILEGRINGMDFNYLMENVLRTDMEEQVISGRTKFGKLTANALQTLDGQISGLNLANIARISADELLIRQPIHFRQNLEVNQLKVLQRLNHIFIENGRMDALFKRSKRIQEIRGLKEFESINLLEPIILSGKINVTSPVMSKIQPIVTINEDVELIGDFELIGNVTVQNLVSAENVFGRSTRYSVGQVLTDGLRLDEPVIDVPLEFQQPIKIGDVRPGTQINDVPIESLIRLNDSETQVIVAPKTFLSDLTVMGVADATEINGINVKQLNDTILKKSAPNQTITGSIQFERITANQVRTDKLIIGKTSIDRLLTLDTNQKINVNVTINGNLLVANETATAEIDHLEISNRIYGVDLQALIDDSYFYSPNESIVITTNKWFADITVGQLVIEGGFWPTGQTTPEILQLLHDVDSELRINGPITLDGSIKIEKLTVTGTINDIPSAKFHQQWLLSKGAQTFTVPQNFTDVTFNDNIQLYGLLNGHDLAELVADTVSKNEPVHLNQVIFDNVIFKKALQMSGKLSGIRIPDDLIFSQSDGLQTFNEAFTFASTVNIFGTLSIADQLNGHHFKKMCEFLEPPPNAPLKLTIKGDIIFNESPTIEYLNSESFEHLRLTTWMANDQHVNFTSSVQFDNVIFDKPITTTGLVNDIDLQNLNDRYLSLTKPQIVTTPIRFMGAVHVRDSLYVNRLELDGLIKVPNSDITLNITDFDQNILKNTNATQFVTGPWRFNEMRFLGSLALTTINGLNFATDVARWDSPSTNIIRAPKRFRSLTIDRLTCASGCTLQGVDMADWISGAVLTGFNYTIQGTVYAENPIISYIEALGPVNNITFNSQNVLLKSADQRLNGPIIIANANQLNSTSAITSLTFDKLYVNFINDKNVSEFFANLIQRNEHGHIDVGEIFSDMEFMNGLDIDHLQITGQLNGINVNENLPIDSKAYGTNQQYRMASEQIDAVVRNLTMRKPFKHFDHMLQRQTFNTDIHDFTKLIGTTDFQFIALNNSNFQFYVWNSIAKALQSNNIPLALPENMIAIDLTVLRVDLMHLLVIQMHNLSNGQFVQQFYDYTTMIMMTDMQPPKLVYEMYDLAETIIEPFNLDVRQCFIMYRKFNATNYTIHCMNSVTDSESQQLKVHQIESDETSEIFYKITGGNANAIIFWFMSGEIESRWYDTQNQRTASQRQQFYNITYVAAAKKPGEKSFIAISMHLDAFNRPNAIDAIVSVYRLNAAESGPSLKHYADIELPDSIVLQCEFSKLSSVQSILVVAVRNGAEEMVLIYQDKGVNGFEQLESHEIRWKVSMSSSLPKAVDNQFAANNRRFTLIESENGILSFIAIYSGEHGMSFVECIYI